jgi:hypothetical protein
VRSYRLNSNILALNQASRDIELAAISPPTARQQRTWLFLLEHTTPYDSPLSSTDRLIKSLASSILENKSLVQHSRVISDARRPQRQFSSNGTDCLIGNSNFISCDPYY